LGQDYEKLSGVTDEELRKVYESIPKNYDRANRFISFGMDVKWRAELVKSVLDLEKNPRSVLDVASGKGETTYVFQRLGLRAFYVLTDYSENMLLNALVEDDRVLASFDHLPFRDDSFDVVISTFALHAADDYESVIKEMARVARKVVGVIAMGKPKNRALQAYLSFYLRSLMPKIACLAGAKPSDYRMIYEIYARKDKTNDYYISIAEKYLKLVKVEERALRLFYAFVGIKEKS
jgi:demethylmenaquinone methyltransferase/2-methoxy-6-polyprenyl-1,4-benzoquinol methylase